MIKSCEICGTPREIKNEWRTPERDSEGKRKGWVEMVSTCCVFGHWYGGPLQDISVEITENDQDTGI